MTAKNYPIADKLVHSFHAPWSQAIRDIFILGYKNSPIII
jgi:hypothetical protein